MALTVRQECPQCGGPFDLPETRRVFACPYCGVRSFLHGEGPFQYILPPAETVRAPLWIPYFRFRGMVFTCAGESVRGKVVDLTGLALDGPGLPPSLGLRPQAMKLRFRTAGVPGHFFGKTLGLSRIIDRAEQTAPVATGGPVHLRASIGETLSVIHLPLEERNRSFVDGITGEPLPVPEETGDAFAGSPPDTDPRPPRYLATVCPECGWDLSGEGDSVVLPCGNCGRAWTAGGASFLETAQERMAGAQDGPALPFWKITAELKGSFPVSTFGDFLEATGRPAGDRPGRRAGRMLFWIPAFKIRPDLFLRLSVRMTLRQDLGPLEEGPPQGRAYPATLPVEEAVQAIPVVLAEALLLKKALFPGLPGVRTAMTDHRLVHVPFREGPLEYVQDRLSLGIHKKTLDFGRFL